MHVVCWPGCKLGSLFTVFTPMQTVYLLEVRCKMAAVEDMWRAHINVKLHFLEVRIKARCKTFGETD